MGLLFTQCLVGVPQHPQLEHWEKPSFLLFGVDLRSPTEAAFLSPSQVTPSLLEDYRHEMMLSLRSAHELAVQAVQKAQK